MTLPDPLLICREILLSDSDITDRIDDRVYATPDLPLGHTYPCIRLTHLGSSEYSPVGFRQAATAGVQMDIWAADMPTLSALAETALDDLYGAPEIPGALYIKPTFEAREIDESVQPPLYRYRADLSVRIARVTAEI